MDDETPHVLIVDDDADLLASVSDVLAVRGFESFKAQTGGDALAQIEERDFDVALIDLRLEDMSGLDVLSAIKARSPETECILLTGHATQDSAIKAIQMNAFGFFQKPFDMDQALLSIQRAVEKGRSARALRESEQNLKKAQGYAHVGSWTWNIKTNQLNWSDEMYRIFGIDKETFTGKLPDVIANTIHPDDREKVEYSNRSVTESGKPIPVEYRVVRADGTVRVVWGEAGELALDDEGNPSFLSGIVQDITERKQAQIALQESEERYRSLVEWSPEPLVVHWDGNILYVNPAVIKMWGAASAQELIGSPILDRIHPDFRQTVLVRREKLDTEGTRTPVAELKLLALDGTVIDAEIQSALIAYKGKPAYYTSMHDVTDRKLAEAALARTNLRLQSLRLIDHALLGASVEGGSADMEALRHLAALVPCGRINIIALDEISDSASFTARVVGEDISVSRVDEPVSIKDLRLNEIREDELTAVKLEPEKLNPLEKELYDINGRSLVKAPLIVQGRLIGILALSSENPDFFTGEHLEIVKDVSAQLALSLHHENLLNEIRRHAEQLEKRVQERTAEIETTRQRLELAVNVGEIGVWEVNLKENKRYWNKRMYLIHGLDPENFDDTDDGFCWDAIHPQDKDLFRKQIEEAIKLTGLLMTEHRILHPDGSIRHVSINAVVLYDANHIPDSMTGVTLDMTDRREAEETMRRANLEMERALRIKDEFLANMSHELRTPLNAIMGISESLLEQTAGALNEKQQKYISTVNESGAHLLSLINDILDLSKIEAGRMELNVSDVLVKSLFDSGFRMVKEMAQKKNVTITFETDERVQYVRGDSRRLLQMLVNLLSNAVKFTPEGGKVGVQVATSPDLDEIQFTVWDTGIGIAEEDMPRLFQPFVQLDSSLSRASSGTGLGLMLVMQMARMHGGNVGVQSEPNKGSRFSISLPWLQAEQDSAAGKMTGESESTLPREKIRAGNILLVEDTESVVMLLSDYLQARGHCVSVARDGLSGLAMAKDECPDVMLLDIQMPGTDGFEVIKRIREDDLLKDIPVIALTALAMPGDRERCLAAGMTDYISKPIRLKELVKMVEGYLEKA